MLKRYLHIKNNFQANSFQKYRQTDRKTDAIKNITTPIDRFTGGNKNWQFDKCECRHQYRLGAIDCPEK